MCDRIMDRLPRWSSRLTICLSLLFFLAQASVPDCGTDGIYDTVEERCRCVSGFTGLSCQTCLTKPQADETHVCCPVKHGQYALLSVPDDNLSNYLGGLMGTRGQCVLPNVTLDLMSIDLDCSCTRNDTKALLLQHSLSSGNDPVSDASYRLTALSGNPSPGWVGDLLEQLSAKNRLQGAILCEGDVSSVAGAIVFISLAGITLLAVIGLIIWVLWSYGFRVNVSKKPRKSDAPKQPLSTENPLFQSTYGTSGGGARGAVYRILSTQPPM